MPCPYLKEVVMLFCRAYPVKKMVPLDRIATASPCLGQDFEHCPIYEELLAHLKSMESGRECACASPEPETGKRVSP